MFGTFILITWVAGMWAIIHAILTAPELDKNERPVNKNKSV
jgi:hypothetical protein